MSLIIGARFQDGVLFASDAFVFDNDGILPQKELSYDKFYVSNKHGFLLTAIGSMSVFYELRDWLDTNDLMGTDSLRVIASKWAGLNLSWKTSREQELGKGSDKTLRPISDSLFMLCKVSELDSIYIVEADGNINRTSSFAFSGSGSYLVESFLRANGKVFSPSDALGESIDLLLKCYSVARRDLYVSGYPAICIVRRNEIMDITMRCAEIGSNCEKKFFDDLKDFIFKMNNA